MKKTIAYASAMAIATATFLGQVPDISQGNEVPILSIISPKVVQAAQGNVSVKLNGNPMTFPSVQPYYDQPYDRTYLPARVFFESLGFQTEWDAAQKVATFKRGDITIYVWQEYGCALNHPQASLPGNKPMVIDGTLMFDARSLNYIPGIHASQNSGSLNILDEATRVLTYTQPSPGRPEVEDIVFDGYVINKVNVGNGVVLCKGDTREVVESLLGKPDRDALNNDYGIDNGLENHSFVYDNLNLYIRYTNDGLLDNISLENSNHSFMGYKIGDSFSLDQELRPYEKWNPGLGYAWPDIMLGQVSTSLKINYNIMGNTSLTNEPKPTSVGLIAIKFYY